MRPLKIFGLLFFLALAGTMITEKLHAQGNPFGRSGFELTSSDIELLKAEATALYTNENVAIGDKAEWRSDESGNHGTIEIIDVFEYKGMPCRRLQHDISITTVNDDFRFIIDRCQIDNGEWKIL